MEFSLFPPQDARPEERKFNDKLVEKLRYCREVLVTIRNASGQPGSESDGASAPPSDAPFLSIPSRPSRAALR